jgi:putative membrane protein
MMAESTTRVVVQIITSPVPPDHIPGSPTRTREGAERRPPGDVGHEPDPRFTFANERTFLAWNRTALALVASGSAAAAFLRTGFGGGRLIVGLPLIVLGAIVALTSYRRWERIERAMRLGDPMPYSRMPWILGLSVAIVSLAAGVLAIVDALST